MLRPLTAPPPPSVRPADTVTAESAIKQLRASKRGKLPIVDDEGRLVGLATRELFKADARLPGSGGACVRWWGSGVGGARPPPTLAHRPAARPRPRCHARWPCSPATD